MRRLIFIVALAMLAIAGLGEADAQGCFPQPRKDGVDFSLPCIPLSAIADADAIVYFESGSATLTSEAKRILMRQAEALRAYPQDHVQMIGYTDTVEATTSGQKGELARKRADAARAYIVSLGIDNNRIVAVGRDYSFAITSSSDEAVLAPLRQVRTELLR